MSTPESVVQRGEVTQLLAAWGAGDPEAPGRIFELLYGELRKLAHCARVGQQHEATLQTTALVHELYLRLLGGFRPAHDDRKRFFGAAAKAMRYILLDRARQRLAIKRGSGMHPLSLDLATLDAASGADATEALAIEDALMALERFDRRLAELVELRFFAGFSIEQTADILGLSPRTVKRDWQKARALLADWISGRARLEPPAPRAESPETR